DAGRGRPREGQARSRSAAARLGLVGQAGSMSGQMNPLTTVDMASALRLLAIATLVAGALLALWWWRQRRTAAISRHVALVALTAFITADLIVFGAFTRLTDSGL